MFCLHRSTRGWKKKSKARSKQTNRDGSKGERLITRHVSGVAGWAVDTTVLYIMLKRTKGKSVLTIEM